MLIPASRLFLLFAVLLSGLAGVGAGRLQAQALSPNVQPVATLRDQLISRLRATTPERKSFIAAVLGQVDQGKLDRGLVLAVERYAVRKNPAFPFPFFERAMRFMAAKKGVNLPQTRQFVEP